MLLTGGVAGCVSLTERRHCAVSLLRSSLHTVVVLPLCLFLSSSLSLSLFVLFVLTLS